MNPQQAATLTALAANPSPTALPFTFAGMAAPGGPVKEAAHTALSTVALHAGERSMRPKTQRGKRRQPVAYQPIVLPGVAFLARYYPRQAWASLPGPWPVKVVEALIMLALLYVAQFIPGQFDDYAVLAMPRLFRWVARHARKAATS